MSDPILVRKSAREWFREVIGDALAHRSMRIQEVTEFYLVDLLASFLSRERLYVEQADGTVRAEPLALILLEALRQDRQTRARELRRLGDTALYVSGFFGDSLARSAAGIDYYIAMGESAYGALATPDGRGKEDVFGELAGRFADFVDLFAEIAELSNLRSNRGLIRLYQRFLATRSERVAELLRERGVALFSGPGRPSRGLKH
ncbi:MAG TPA: hypothetical protein VFG59_21605 [Anaeromyxobacter sp.]|nr:hypothetical protein [Anaeromyxobacter sp.]